MLPIPTRHPVCALHINNSASGCLPSWFTPLVIISLPLMVLSLYCVTGSFTGTNHNCHGYVYNGTIKSVCGRGGGDWQVIACINVVLHANMYSRQ